MKLMATGMLVVVITLFNIAHFKHGAGIWPWVEAFAEAAMVGAPADSKPREKALNVGAHYS